jgi:hypothetical protein
MAIEAVRAKLQEARSFLNEMDDQQQKAFGDTSRFDHLLSAFTRPIRRIDLRSAIFLRELLYR